MAKIALTLGGILALAVAFSACTDDESDDRDSGGGGSSKFNVGSGGLKGVGGSALPGVGGSDAGATSAGGASEAGPPPGSCKGACGGVSSQECFCDPECELYGDCCADFGAECKNKFSLPTGCIIDPYFLLLCNPVTNEGCDAAGGEACDWAGAGMKCWADGNTVGPGEACYASLNKFCVATYTCEGATRVDPIGVCKRYCCASTDCGGSTCKAFYAQLGTLGVCSSSPDAGAGDAAGD